MGVSNVCARDIAILVSVMVKLIRAVLLAGWIAAVASTTIFTQSKRLSAAANPLVREEQTIIIDGRSEIWRLEWESPPKPACGLEDPASSLTCPCIGFAYGESGQLDLARVVKGREIDRLRLAPLFEKMFADQGGVLLQRWAVQDADLQDFDNESFAATVPARPVVTIMRFADYNHDGQATEFFLQTGVEPCGKITGIVIGVTADNPKLHAFVSTANPGKPLYLQKPEWEVLLKTTGPVQVLDWPCGDHGSENEKDVELSVTKSGIRAVRKTFECTETGKRGHLLEEKPF